MNRHTYSDLEAPQPKRKLGFHEWHSIGLFTGLPQVQKPNRKLIEVAANSGKESSRSNCCLAANVRFNALDEWTNNTFHIV